jgi:hypothetical protein
MEALHDSSYNKFGPGHILRSEMIKHFIDFDEITQIDQVRGGETYKRYWLPNGKERHRRGVSIFNHNFRGLILSFLMTRILPRLQKYPTLLNAKRFFPRLFEKFLC